MLLKFLFSFPGKSQITSFFPLMYSHCQISLPPFFRETKTLPFVRLYPPPVSLQPQTLCTPESKVMQFTEFTLLARSDDISCNSWRGKIYETSSAPFMLPDQLMNSQWFIVKTIMNRVFIEYCVSFFEDFKIYSGLWPLSVSPRCQCVYTMAGQTPVLQQTLQSSEKSQHFKEKHNI